MDATTPQLESTSTKSSLSPQNFPKLILVSTKARNCAAGDTFFLLMDGETEPTTITVRKNPLLEVPGAISIHIEDNDRVKYRFHFKWIEKEHSVDAADATGLVKEIVRRINPVPVNRAKRIKIPELDESDEENDSDDVSFLNDASRNGNFSDFMNKAKGRIHQRVIAQFPEIGALLKATFEEFDGRLGKEKRPLSVCRRLFAARLHQALVQQPSHESLADTRLADSSSYLESARHVIETPLASLPRPSNGSSSCSAPNLSSSTLSGSSASRFSQGSFDQGPSDAAAQSSGTTAISQNCELSREDDMFFLSSDGAACVAFILEIFDPNPR